LTPRRLRAIAYVRQGAIYLSTHYPNCMGAIDLATLAVGSATDCPVAQAAGLPFGETLVAKVFTLGDLDRHGFIAWSLPERLLNDAWRDEILGRRWMD
jgi:hypothetical protein